MVDIITFDNVLAVADHHQLRLSPSQSLLDRLHALVGDVVNVVKINNFDCDCFGSIRADSLVDCSVVAFADFFGDDVVSQFFLDQGLVASQII